MDFIKTLCDPALGVPQLMQGLAELQNYLIMCNFKKKDEATLIDDFKNIWKSLLITSANSSSTIRLASYKATGIFLTKITPYYPNEVCKSFSEIALEATITAHNSAIIASSFAYITRFIAPLYLEKFLKSTPVFHHFSFVDPSFSEYIAQIITNSEHLGKDWLKILLHSLLERIESNENRHLSKAVAAIVNHDPYVMFNELVDFIIENNKPQDKPTVLLNHLSLLAYVLSNIEGKTNKLELFEIAEASVSILSRPNRTVVESDSAFQILGIENRSFSVNITNNQEILNIEIKNNDETKTASTSFNMNDFKDSPALYVMPLPIEILLPKETDGPSVVNAKIITLGRIANTITDTKELDKILNVLIVDSNTGVVETSVSVNNAISKSIRNIVKHASIEVLSKLIKNVIFVEKMSWYRALSMLKIIDNINVKVFIERIGRPIYNDILEIVCNFCYERNESLYITASNLLAKIVSKQDIPFVCSVLAHNNSFFSGTQLQRTLLAFNKILTKFNEPIPEISAYADAVTECSEYFDDDLNVLSSIFEFLALSKSPSNEKIRDIAMNICKSYITTISGEKWGNSPVQTKYQSQVDEVISMRSMDVVAQPIDDILKFLDPFRSTVRFLLQLPKQFLPSDFAIELCTKVFPIFPREITNYFAVGLSEFPENVKLQFISGVYNRLQFVSDINVLAKWCEIVLKNDAVFFEKSQTETLAFFNAVTIYFKNASISLTNSQALSFSMLVARMSEDPVEDISKFISKVKPNQRNHFIEEFDQQVPSLIDAIKQKYPEIFNFKNSNNEILQTHDSALNIIFENDRQSLQEQFVSVVQKKELYHLFQTIHEASSKKITLMLDDILIPKSFVTTFSNLVSKTIYVDMSINNAMSCMRSDLGELALSKLQDKVDDVFKIFEEKEHLKKSDILNLSSLVSFLPCDVDKISKIGYKALNENNTKGRLATVSLLLAAGTFLYRSVPQEVFDSFYELVKDEETTREISYALSVIITRTKIDQKAIDLIKKMSSNCGIKTSIQSILHLPLISSQTSPEFLDDISNKIRTYIVSVMPSLFISALRMFEHCASVFDEQKFLQIARPSFEHICNRYKLVQYNPPLVSYSTSSLKIAAKQGIPVYKWLDLLRVENHKPAFLGFCDLLPYLIKYTSQNEATFNTLVDISMKLLSYNGFVFSRALMCLENRMDKIENVESRSSILLDILFQCIGKNSDDEIHDWFDGWINLLEKYLKPPHLTSIIIFKFLKYNFSRSFISLAKYVHRNKSPEVSEVLLTGEEICEFNCQKYALKLLAEGQHIKEAIHLSIFASDCAESDELINSLSK